MTKRYSVNLFSRVPAASTSNDIMYDISTLTNSRIQSGKKYLITAQYFGFDGSQLGKVIWLTYLFEFCKYHQRVCHFKLPIQIH